jgi:hypothetical protein
MMRLRGLAFVLVALALAVVPLAAAVPSATSAHGTIVKMPDGSYSLEIEVTGDTVQCMRYTAPPGITITSASGPGQTGFAGSIFGAQGTNITSGSSKTWTFKTDKPLSQSNKGTLAVSTTCAVGSDVSATLELADFKCKCVSFNARIIPGSLALFGITPQSLNLGFTIGWELTCTAGLSGCVGLFVLTPPQPAAALGTKIRLVKLDGKLGPATGKAACKGKCGEKRTGIQKFRLFGKQPLGSKNRAGKSFELSLARTCEGDKLNPLTFTLVFDKLGQVDKKKSDLNANGKPDGKSGKG